MTDHFSAYGIQITLHQRKPGGPWHAYFRAHGKKIRVSTGTLNRNDARALARAECERILADTPEQKKNTPWTLREAVEQSAENWATKSPRTAASAASRLAGFAEFRPDFQVGGCPMKKMSALVQEYLTERGRTWAARTVIGDQLTISAFCAWIMRAHPDKVDWPANPAQKKLMNVARPRATRNPVPTDEQIEKIIEYCEPGRGKPGHLCWPLVVMLLGCGMRPGGAAAARWEDMDLDAGRARHRDKTGDRSAPISAWAREKLAAWRLIQPQKPWPHRVDTAIHYWAHVRAELGLPDWLTLQSLRRYAANRLMAATPNLSEYAHAMGHSIQTAEKFYLAQKKPDAAINSAWDYAKKS